MSKNGINIVDGQPVAVLGSGWHHFTKGERVTHPKQVKVGDLLLDYSRQFDAYNVIKVTQTFEKKGNNNRKFARFYGVMVNPLNTNEVRIHSCGPICFWDSGIARDESPNRAVSDLWRAVGDPCVKPPESPKPVVDEAGQAEPEPKEDEDPRQLTMFY